MERRGRIYSSMELDPGFSRIRTGKVGYTLVRSQIQDSPGYGEEWYNILLSGAKTRILRDTERSGRIYFCQELNPGFSGIRRGMVGYTLVRS